MAGQNAVKRPESCMIVTMTMMKSIHLNRKSPTMPSIKIAMASTNVIWMETGFYADSTHCIAGVECCQYGDDSPGDDCDDRNANINPSMTEGDPDAGGFADGLDNDCSGEVDEPYQDRDGDGWTEAEGDCWDDADDIRSALVYPGAEELCDDFLDNDCNGLYNDNCTNPRDMLRFKAEGLRSASPSRLDGRNSGVPIMWESWPY